MKAKDTQVKASNAADRDNKGNRVDNIDRVNRVSKVLNVSNDNHTRHPKHSWGVKKLGEVCVIQGGSTPKRTERLYWEDGTYPWFTIEDIRNQGRIITDTKQKITKIAWDKLRVFPKDTILLCCTASIGEYAITHIPLTTNQQFNGLMIKDKSYLSPMYLMHFCATLKEKLSALSGKAIIDFVSAEKIRQIPIPIPGIEEQERIVGELDCLSGVIEKKREQLKLLDALAQSIFYDMFGDPISNEKGFPVYKIDDIITFQGGSQPDKSHFEYEPTDDNIRLIQIRDYKSDKNITYIPKSLARRLCNAEDIMIGRYGPPIFQILKGIEGAYNVALMKAIPKQGNREFIRAFLKQKCLLEYLESMSKRTAGQDGIQMDKLKAYPFPLPPIELQDEFADKIEAIEKQKELLKRSIKEVETLFDARMDYYLGDT